MKKAMRFPRAASCRAFAALAATALTGTIRAQAPDPASDEPATGSGRELEAMVSTGTILQKSELAGSLPVTTFDRKFIEHSGASTLTQLLMKLPQSTGARFTETVNTGVSFVPGASAVSLRGLNVNATLVLLNGRRMPVFALSQSGTDAFVDINSIPLAAIDRVEILREGASAIYGSDAIAGVVNIITKSGVNDTTVFGQYGNTTRQDDVGQKRASIVTGMNKERYRWMFAADYFQQNPLANRDRDFSRTADHRKKGGTDQRSVRANPGTFFPSTGVLRPPPGNDGSPSADEFLNGLDRTDNFINRYNFNKRVELIPSSERAGYFGNFEFDVTKNVTLFAEGLYQENRTKDIAAPTPIDSADGLFVPASNPYNPFGEDVSFLYRLTEGGDRLNFTNSKTFRYIAGVRVKNLPGNWQAELAGTTSENMVTSRGENYFSASRAQEALNKTDPDKALNVFGDGEGYNAMDVIEGMRVSPYTLARSEQRLLDFRASGDLPFLRAPAGPVSAGFGAEYREEELSVTLDPRSRPDPVTLFGDIIGAGSASAEGQRSSKSIYYQANIPLAGPTFNAPGIRALNLDFAGRYEEATDYGDTFKPKFSVRYKPLENLTLRASYQEGYRAPSLAQRFAGAVVAFETATDPVNGQVNDYMVVSSGSTALRPEKSYSQSAGFVLDVPYVTGLSISADFYRIEQRDFIDSPTAQTVLDNPGFGSVIRDDEGNLIQINAPYTNIGLAVTDGVDIEVTYDLPWKQLGEWKLAYYGNYINSFEQTPQPGFENVEFIRTQLLPAFRSIATLDWEWRGFGAGGALNYTSGYYDADLNPQQQRRVEGWATVDFYASYTFGSPETPEESDGKSVKGAVSKESKAIGVGPAWWQKWLAGTTFKVGVNNVADEDPPFVNLTEGYDTSAFDPSGRFYYVAITKKF
jgi:iron complex outermembrane recepter protein